MGKLEAKDIGVNLAQTIYEMEKSCIDIVSAATGIDFSSLGIEAEEKVSIPEGTKLLLCSAIVAFKSSPQEHSEEEKQGLFELITSASSLMRDLMGIVRENNPETPRKYYDVMADYLDKMAADLSQIMLPNVGKNNGTPKK